MLNPQLIKATPDDFEIINNHYYSIIENTPEQELYSRWIKDVYPTREIIYNYIKQDAMYILVDNGAIAGSVAVTLCQGNDYHKINWNINVDDNQVAVIHLLGVNPRYIRQDIGSILIDKAVDIACDNKINVIRLDALASNLPAHRLYLKKGFVFCGSLNLYADNTGYTDFYFFEYLIKR